MRTFLAFILALAAGAAFASDKFFSITTPVADGGNWTTPIYLGPNRTVDVLCRSTSSGSALPLAANGYLTSRGSGFPDGGGSFPYKIACNPLVTGCSTTGATKCGTPVDGGFTDYFRLNSGPDYFLQTCSVQADGGLNEASICFVYDVQVNNDNVRIQP